MVNSGRKNMREIIVDKKYDGKRIDKYLKEIFPRLPYGALQKAMRKKDIKVGGIRVKQDYTVHSGETVEVYITDDILDGIQGANGSGSLNSGFTVVYEDDNILIVNKEQGIPVHPDKDQDSGTLIDRAASYLEQKGEYSRPSLCHRLDRNTGGLVILAKDPESLEIILGRMKAGDIRKYYKCLVKGKMDKYSAELTAYLQKDEHKSRVFISDKNVPGSSEIITRYTQLDYDPEKDISLLEIELITGKTHQIRAHLAFTGHPIIGDGKYGSNSINRPLGAKVQALWACKLVFNFKEAGKLSYLKGRRFQVEPGFRL
jgi:23S rRNA pseudouridine955/2504/2580 synthase